jgi:hypothetical protein
MATRTARTTKKKKSEGRIPTFKTVEEEAEFWDTHDSVDFEDEFEDAPDIIFVKAGPKKTVSVRLDAASLEAVTKRAREMGIGPSTLIRLWVLERLRGEQK